MNTEFDRLGAGLADLAEAAAPPSSVDVGEARRVGRSRLRRRRFAVLGTVTAVAVGAATLATALPGTGGSTAVGPAGTKSVRPSLTSSPTGSWSPRPPSTANPSMSQTVVPFTGHDPLNADATFGWLPDTVRTVTYSLEFDGMRLVAVGAQEGINLEQISLRVFPAGVTPGFLKETGMPPDPIRLDAPQVNGREAYWISSGDPAYPADAGLLRWRTADGRWAQLNSNYLPKADRQKVPLRVAAGVTVGLHTVPLPFRLTGVPESYKVGSVHFDQPVGGSKDPWRVGMTYSVSGTEYFTTTVTPESASATASGEPGRPGPGFDRPRACRSELGLQVCVTPLQAASMLDPVGGMDGWLQKVTLLGTDQSKWTTEVLG